MVTIIIAGGGEIGQYTASILSQHEYRVVIVDPNGEILKQNSNLPRAVLWRRGEAYDWQVLDDLLELSPHMFIALTESDETNLVSCSIAKHLGYPHTIARVRNRFYFNQTRLGFSRIFNVDYLVGSELLAANEIVKYILNPEAQALEHFAHGAIQLRSFRIPQEAEFKSIHELKLPDELVIGLIYRESDKQQGKPTLLFPHKDEAIFPGDELTLIGESDLIAQAHRFFGIKQREIQSVVIVGGSLTGIHLAHLLAKKGIEVTLFEKNYEKCCLLMKELPECKIVHRDAMDQKILRSHRVEESDAFVACTDQDEFNLCAALLGKEVGSPSLIVMLSNSDFFPIAKKQGIVHVVSPRISTANHILSQILSGKVNSLISLYDNQAEVVEVRVSNSSRLVGIPISRLKTMLPENFLVAMIQNRGRLMAARGEKIISPGDLVVMVTVPQHLRDLELIL